MHKHTKEFDGQVCVAAQLLRLARSQPALLALRRSRTGRQCWHGQQHLRKALRDCTRIDCIEQRLNQGTIAWAHAGAEWVPLDDSQHESSLRGPGPGMMPCPSCSHSVGMAWKAGHPIPSRLHPPWRARRRQATGAAGGGGGGGGALW